MALSGAAAQYIEKEFGGAFEEADETVSVGTSATRVVGHNPDCVAIVFINLGANTVYLKPANNPSSTSGIKMVASGGFLSMNVRDDLTLPSLEWYGIADTAASDLYYIRTNRFSSLPSAVEAPAAS